MLYMCPGPGQNVCGSRSIHRTVCNPGDCSTPCRLVISLISYQDFNFGVRLYSVNRKIKYF